MYIHVHVHVHVHAHDICMSMFMCMHVHRRKIMAETSSGADPRPPEGFEAFIERLVANVSTMPPRATPEQVALSAESLPVPAVSSLIVALCTMLQTLVREVRARPIAACGAGTTNVSL